MNIEIPLYIIMPNHVHLIVNIINFQWQTRFYDCIIQEYEELLKLYQKMNEYEKQKYICSGGFISRYDNIVPQSCGRVSKFLDIVPQSFFIN